MILSH